MLWLGDDAAHLRFPWIHGFRCFLARVDGWQHFAWSLRVRARRPLSLLVPLPVARDGQGPPIRETITDLELRTGFFQALDRGFPGAQRRVWSATEDFDFDGETVPLVFDLADHAWQCTPDITLAADRAALGDDAALDGLDDLLAGAPLYADWGFAWLRIPRGDWELRTLGLAFRMRHPDALHVPTMHVDDEAPELAVYDHTIFFQGPAPVTLHGRAPAWPGPCPGAPWSVRPPEPSPGRSAQDRNDATFDGVRCGLQDREERGGPGRVTPIATSAQPAGAFAPTRTGLLDPDSPVSRFELTGILPNDTLWISPAAST